MLKFIKILLNWRQEGNLTLLHGFLFHSVLFNFTILMSTSFTSVKNRKTEQTNHFLSQVKKFWIILHNCIKQKETFIILHAIYVFFSDNGQEFGGSIYQKINPQLETGISLNWSSGSSNTKFGIGAKYDLDSAANLRVKVNNSSQIGLGYQQRLRDGK